MHTVEQRIPGLFMLTAVRNPNDYPHFSGCLNAIALSNFYHVQIFLIIVLVAGSLSIMMSFSLLFRFRWSSGGPILWLIKSFSSALAPFLFAMGAFCVLVGIIIRSVAATVLGVPVAIVSLIYLFRIFKVTDASTGLKKAFGPDWEDRISAERKAKFLKTPLTLLLPANKDFIFKRNISFSSVPGTNRELFCDLWLPSQNVRRSGLAFIYFHGSAWSYLDKDFFTRPLFRHLASQGHVIMDVAYRLFPETDMTGMVNDAKRAVAWMKANTSKYGVSPDHIVIGGGSAGGHIALLAAYLPDELKLNPPELQSVDLSVQAVVAAYGPPDLRAHYYHTGQHIARRSKPNQVEKTEHGVVSRWMKQLIGKNYYRLGFNKPSSCGTLASILGFRPDENPDMYDFFSPIAHVASNCPPTLMVHGEHDMFAPVAATKLLYEKLNKAGVLAALYLVPQTDHGFDLFMSKISPVAHTALYIVERYLALMAISERSKNFKNFQANPQNQALNS